MPFIIVTINCLKDIFFYFIDVVLLLRVRRSALSGSYLISENISLLCTL